MDNFLILARLKLYRKNYHSFVGPSITAWFFALIAGLIYNLKKLIFLKNQMEILLKNRDLSSNASLKFKDDLRENKRLSLICWLNIVKNLFDLVPASYESGLVKRSSSVI